MHKENLNHFKKMINEKNSDLDKLLCNENCNECLKDQVNAIMDYIISKDTDSVINVNLDFTKDSLE